MYFSKEGEDQMMCCLPVSLPTIPAPTAVYAGDCCIVIDGLPVIDSEFKIAKSGLMRIVHKYKHLLTHGFWSGRTARSRGPADNDEVRLPIAYTFRLVRQAEASQIQVQILTNAAVKPLIRIHEEPTCTQSIILGDLDQPDDIIAEQLSAQTDNSINPDENLRRLQRLWQHTHPTEPEPAIPDGFREMTPEEVERHLDYYCEQCANELQDYLNKIYLAALRDGTKPEYLCASTQS